MYEHFLKSVLNFEFYSLLPAPTQPVWDRDEERAKIRVPASSLVVASPTAPPYGQRRGWVPRSLEVCF